MLGKPHMRRSRSEGRGPGRRPLVSSCTIAMHCGTVSVYQAIRSFAFCAFARFSFTTVIPINDPTADSPETRMKAGSRTAHSLEGKKS